jgi:hypothetical protein
MSRSIKIGRNTMISLIVLTLSAIKAQRAA